jgi:CTP:phosphocholine cytidylyltransferase-like protein
MSFKVDNAVIMAAGTSSRFAPLSYERPKALIEVRGEVLIERQIKQLREAGIGEIIVVTGYKADQFAYLHDKFGVKLVHNPDYLTRNNNASIWAVKDRLRNTYICSSDNYFSKNPFESEVDGAYYAAVYADGETKEWCMTEDANGYIDSVTVGGRDAWYMLGHAFWSEDFTSRFVSVLEEIYDLPETADLLWESIYMAHFDELKMRIRKYPDDVIFEFDTLDELRAFDTSYIADTRSTILRAVASGLGCTEAQIVNVRSFKKGDNAAAGIRFTVGAKEYEYSYETKIIKEI